jgi:hypothetical protein
VVSAVARAEGARSPDRVTRQLRNLILIHRAERIAAPAGVTVWAHRALPVVVVSLSYPASTAPTNAPQADPSSPPQLREVIGEPIR